MTVETGFEASETPPDPDFLRNGGTVGTLLGRMDWSSSPLGRPEHWPQSLRSTLGLLLPCSAQICLFWGDELVAFYNDAYMPAIGANHPAALGRPAREGWAALWHSLEPLLRGVLETGVPVHRGSQLFEQNLRGFVEDTYYDISYSAVRGDGERVLGVFCIVHDQTRRVIDERRLNTLRVLSLRPPDQTPEAAASSFVDTLAREDRIDAPYVLVYLRVEDGGLALAASHGGSPDPALRSVPARPGRDAGPPDPRLEALRRALATGQVESLTGPGYLSDPPELAAERQVLLPLSAGADIAGVLVLAKNRRMVPTADYRRFSVLLAAQLSASLSTARVLVEQRHRSQALERQVAAALADRAVAEAQLRQSQKMEAIGKLTGGVAHDFNNLLQVVGGNLQLLGRDVAGNARAERRIDNAMAGVARGAKLSSQLLAFSRRQPLEPRVVGIDTLIGGLDDMLRHTLGEAVEVEIAVEAGVWKTLVDPAQLENALLNLAINARDAMEGGGRLTIEAGNTSLDDAQARRDADLLGGQYVVVSVTDTGAGMTPEIMEQVFEPFFSTKPEGKGTGLGLSMVYGFVKQSGGHVKLHSEPGHGTTVRLYLPRTLQAEDAPARPDEGPVSGGTETILVAEDDEGVRDTVVSMLGELGYRVLKARDAESALSVIESGVPVDLLFTDVVMPGTLRGPDLAARARARLPGLAVLFTSGYTEDAFVHDGRLDPGIELLSKPYSREALARRLRHVLSFRAPAAPAAATAAATAAAGPSRRVLLVEDDARIRELGVEMLGAGGHRVAAAAGPEQALALLDGQMFDVLVTDLGLPGMDGASLARHAVARRPGLGVVYATGRDAAGADAPALDRAVLLRKPYDGTALLDAVRASLAR